MVTEVDCNVTESNKEFCVVNQRVFQVKEDAYSLLEGLSPLYEIICFTKLPLHELKAIEKHFDEYIDRLANEEFKFKFDYILDETHYEQICNLEFENAKKNATSDLFLVDGTIRFW